MTSSSDDIAPLFKRFGAKVDQFREIARDQNTQGAGRRWPMLQDVPVQARDMPSALTGEQRQRRLGYLSAGAEEVCEAQLEKPENKISAGLGRLNGIRRAEVGRATVVAHSADVQPDPPREEAPAHVRAVVEPVRKVIASPVQSKPKSGGLFGQKPVAEVAPPQGKSGFLGALFSRLEGKRQLAPQERKRTGLFGRGKF